MKKNMGDKSNYFKPDGKGSSKKNREESKEEERDLVGIVRRVVPNVCKLIPMPFMEEYFKTDPSYRYLRGQARVSTWLTDDELVRCMRRWPAEVLLYQLALEANIENKHYYRFGLTNAEGLGVAIKPHLFYDDKYLIQAWSNIGIQNDASHFITKLSPSSNVEIEPWRCVENILDDHGYYDALSGFCYNGDYESFSGKTLVAIILKKWKQLEHSTLVRCRLHAGSNDRENLEGVLERFLSLTR